ncbi:MAG: TolC family protein [Brachymonas sp.]|nr:TolC family protein [Brachymonas sp.]
MKPQRPLRFLLPSLMLAAGSLLLALPAQAASELGAIAQKVLVQDPLVLEANARTEEAEILIKRSQAQHYPRLSVQSATPVLNRNSNDPTSSNYAALTGRLNLYSFGAIEAQVKRDTARRDMMQLKSEETRENLLYTVSGLYLQALRAKDQMAVEGKNLARHHAIMENLAVIAKYDEGRRSEFVQAQARSLQVQNRIYQYRRIMMLNLAKLQRYYPEPITLRTDFEEGWRKLIAGLKDNKAAEHPSLLAQRAELEAIQQEMKHQQAAQWPRIELEVQQAHSFNSGARRVDPQARIVLEWNFFDLGTRYTARSYAQQYEASAARERLLQQDLGSRTQMALVDIEETLRQAEAAQEQIKASEQVAEMYKLQFTIGRRTLIDLLNANNELANMEMAQTVNRNDQRSAMLELLHTQALLKDWVIKDSTPPPLGDKPFVPAEPAVQKKSTPAAAAQAEPPPTAASDAAAGVVKKVPPQQEAKPKTGT